jgi:putative membrane protein
VAGLPGAPLALGLPAAPRRGAYWLWRAVALRAARRTLASPVAVAALHALAVWSWHLPTLYEAGLTSPWWHALEHASFLGSALAFWALVLPAGRRRRLGHAPAIFLVFVTALQGAALGAVLTFATRPLYPTHVRRALTWGIGPLTDQQLAGLIMWVPAGIVYLLVMLCLFGGWMKDAERRSESSVAIGAGDAP